MAEPQPSAIREGADAEDIEHPPVPASAEDRKAAAALSSLDAKDDDDSAAQKPDVDQKALGDAMSRLQVAGKGKETGENKAKTEGEVKKKVKVDQADVALLVSPLLISAVLGGAEANGLVAGRRVGTEQGQGYGAVEST